MTVDVLDAFAAQVGGTDAGPVVAVGGRTQFDVGGAVSPAAREVSAPAGIVEYEPAEMTVRVRAGTTVVELDNALAHLPPAAGLRPTNRLRRHGGLVRFIRS